uniref:AB hydrolase-1 domain-containing protein n=1 Tax=Quercus lobata TaxID=97700 RepID=A0A7N2R8Q6_QUELO
MAQGLYKWLRPGSNGPISKMYTVQAVVTLANEANRDETPNGGNRARNCNEFLGPKETPNKSKNSNNKAVVFIHGFAVDGIITWQSKVLALVRKYKVYVPDLLFFGGSITDRSERSPEFQAECVAKSLKKLGMERCSLVGLSYGGMVGFKMAEIYPDLVESMVLTCSAMALTKSISDAALERIEFKSWSDYMLPDSVQGVKILFDIFATFKLPWIPNFQIDIVD